MNRYLRFDKLNRKNAATESEFWSHFFAVEPDPNRHQIAPSIDAGYLRKLLHESRSELELSQDSNFMVALDGLEPIARISMNRSLHDQSLGYFGCFDYSIYTSRATESAPIAGAAAAMRELLKKSEKWFVQNGISRIIGPVCLSTWFPYRLQTEEYTGHIFSWEPRTPVEYSEMLQDRGFRADFRYSSFCVENLSAIEASLRNYETNALRDGFVFKTLHTSEIPKNIETLHKLTIDTFQGKFLFEPIPLRAFARLYLSGQSLNQAQISVDLVYAPGGEAIGFMLSHIEEGHIVLKTMGILRPFRRGGLAFALAARAIRLGLANQCSRLVGALLYADGKSMNWWNELTQPGKPLWEHKYSLFYKELSNDHHKKLTKGFMADTQPVTFTGVPQ